MLIYVFLDGLQRKHVSRYKTQWSNASNNVQVNEDELLIRDLNTRPTMQVSK